jgi:hypothetical protein
VAEALARDDQLLNAVNAPSVSVPFRNVSLPSDSKSRLGDSEVHGDFRYDVRINRSLSKRTSEGECIQASRDGSPLKSRVYIGSIRRRNLELELHFYTSPGSNYPRKEVIIQWVSFEDSGWSPDDSTFLYQSAVLRVTSGSTPIPN